MLKQIIKRLLGKRPVRTIPDDPFIQRLRSSVIGEGMLHKGNVYLMDHAIQHMPEGGNVLEIGSYGGLSTNLLIYLMNKYHREEKLFTCDPWIYEGYFDEGKKDPKTIDGRTDVHRTAYMKHIKNSFIQSTLLLSKEQLPYTIEMTSDHFFAAYDKSEEVTDVFGRTISLGGPISFAYIDGNHAYEYVKRDFENISKHLMKDGFILFDDSWDKAGFGSSKFMQEVKEDGRFRFIDKNPNYLFQMM